MPRIPSQPPKTTRTTRNTLKTTNKAIRPWATIPLTTRPIVIHPHQVTPIHIPPLLTLFTQSLHHRHNNRNSISSNRSNSRHMVLSPLIIPSALTLRPSHLYPR